MTEDTPLSTVHLQSDGWTLEQSVESHFQLELCHRWYEAMVLCLGNQRQDVNLRIYFSMLAFGRH